MSANGAAIARSVPETHAVDIWAMADLPAPWCINVVATLRMADHIAAGARGMVPW